MLGGDVLYSVVPWCKDVAERSTLGPVWTHIRQQSINQLIQQSIIERVSKQANNMKGEEFGKHLPRIWLPQVQYWPAIGLTKFSGSVCIALRIKVPSILIEL